MVNPHVAAKYDTRPAYRMKRVTPAQRRSNPDYYAGLRDALSDVAAASPPEYIGFNHDVPALTADLVQGPALDKPKVVADNSREVTPARLKQREAFNVHENSRDVRTTDNRPTCKLRPKDNRPRKGGGGGSRDFIPWCSR